MTPRRSRTPPVILILVALSVAAGCAWWWQLRSQRHAIALASVPTRVDWSGQPAELVRRIESAERQVRTGEDPLAALGQLSQLYHANGYYPSAAACYDGLLRADHANPLWGYRYAAILADSGRLDVALPLLRETARLAPDYVPALLRLADALLKLNQPAAAREAYAAVLARETDNVYALFGLARLDFQAALWPAARDRLETVVTRTAYAIGYDLLPTVYEQLGDHDRAVAIRARVKASGAYQDAADPWLDDLLDDCYDPYRLSVAAGAAHHRGETNAAFRWIERALTLAPESAEFHFQLATFHLAQRNEDQAREQLRASLAANPAFSDAWIALASQARRRGESVAADRLILEGLEACPRSPGLHLEQGLRLLRLDRPAEAIVAFTESIRLRSDEVDAYINLANAHLKLNQSEEALRVLRQALAIEPDNPTALSTLALSSIGTGDEPAAREWLQRVRRQTRFPPDQLRRLEQLYQRQFGRAP